MNNDDLARRIVNNLLKPEISTMTDAELRTIADAPLTERERAAARLYSDGRTDDFNQLTDNELERIVNGWPPA